MERSSFREGYAAVSHSDEGLQEKDDYKLPSTHKANERGSMLSEKESLQDVEPSPSTSDNDRTFLQRCNSFWVWELAACIVSLICLGVVIGTLVWLDHKPLDRWVFRMTPAAFLSTFVTISRFMMLVGVTEAIGQLRWLYYLGGSRRLDHLDSFESASRGPWGALLFICRTSIKGIAPLIARFGALIMVVALAMDPFTQQIVRYETQNLPVPDSGEAWLYGTNASVPVSGTSVLSDEAKRRSIYGGLLNFNQTMDFGCASGNCTWDDFTSLGYGIACHDVASTVERECVAGSGTLGEDCTAIVHSLPNYNLSLILQNGSYSLDSTADNVRLFTLIQGNTTDPYPDGLRAATIFRFLMGQLLVERLDGGFNTTDLRDASWNLTLCDVHWSAKLYHGLSVLNGTFVNSPARDLDLVAFESSQCWSQQPLTCQEFTPSNASATPKGSSTVFHIEIDESPATVRNLLDVDYNITVSGHNFTNDTSAAYDIATSLFWNVNITYTFENVATSLTDFLRQTSAPQHVVGRMKVNTTVVKIRWGWFALPAALDLAGPIFLICVIVYTWRGVKGERFIWKTNTIPLLMHGLEGYHRHGYAGAETTGAIFHKAREMNVQLRRNEDGEIRFVRT